MILLKNARCFVNFHLINSSVFLVFVSCVQAERQMEEYQGMKAFILGWTEKADALVTGSIIWSSASQLQEQIRAHQVSLNESHSREWELLQDVQKMLQKMRVLYFYIYFSTKIIIFMSCFNLLNLKTPHKSTFNWICSLVFNFSVKCLVLYSVVASLNKCNY